MYLIGGNRITFTAEIPIFTLFLVMKMEIEGPLFCSVKDGVLHRIGYSSSVINRHRFRTEEEDYKLHLFSLKFNSSTKSYFYGIDREVLNAVEIPKDMTHYPWSDITLAYGGTGCIYDIIIYDKILSNEAVAEIQKILCSYYDLN